MLALVNGMDVVKSPDLMGGKEYKGHMKNKGISLGMLSNGVDAVKSPSLNGC